MQYRLFRVRLDVRRRSSAVSGDERGSAGSDTASVQRMVLAVGVHKRIVRERGTGMSVDWNSIHITARLRKED